MKRQENKDDIKRLFDIEKYLFSGDHEFDVNEFCDKFKLNTVSKYSDVKTLNNLGYFNFRCSQVNDRIHKEVLKHKEKWFVGLEIVCRKYHKEKGITLNTNYTYRIVSFQKDKKTVCIHDDVDDEYYTIKVSMLETHFTLTYCRTTDSSQGRTIEDKIMIFDIGLSNYMSKQHIWVAMTRATKLENVTIFLHSASEKNVTIISNIINFYYQ